MKLVDPIDSLLELFENPLPKNQARADFEESLIALNDHLRHLIETHSGTVTDRHQAKITIQCMSLSNLIGEYFELVNPKTGWGN